MRAWADSPITLIRVGFAGSIAMAVASFWVAAVPMYFRGGHTPVVSSLGVGAVEPRIAFYLGFAALVLAWLRLGALHLAMPEGGDPRLLRRAGLLWMAPLIASIPLASRDLWAYSAQSQLVLNNLDPYRFGPSALPGAFSVEVSHRWVDTPAPYGPLWLSLGRGIAAMVGQHVGMTVVALRLVAVAGFLMLAWAIPRLSERAGGRADIGTWAVLLNPLVLVLGVGGGHNDLLMVGLLAIGLVVVTRPGGTIADLVAGMVLLALATAVKSPAAVAVAFAVPLWLAGRPASCRWRQGPRPVVVVLGSASVAIGVFAAVTAASGLGFGWVGQVNSSTSVVSWMSLPTLVAVGWDVLHGEGHHALRLDGQMETMRTIGSAVAVMILLALWLWAMRRALKAERVAGGAARRDAVAVVWSLLAAAFVVVVILGPAVQPWYFLWALVGVVALRLRNRQLALIAGLSIGMVAMIRPNGVGLQMNPAVVPILIIPVLVARRAFGLGSRRPVVGPARAGRDRLTHANP